ncbi:unnamed protein product [Lampetra planeri]
MRRCARGGGSRNSPLTIGGIAPLCDGYTCVVAAAFAFAATWGVGASRGHWLGKGRRSARGRFSFAEVCVASRNLYQNFGHLVLSGCPNWMSWTCELHSLPRAHRETGAAPLTAAEG